MSELYRRMKVSAGLAQQAFKSTVEEDEEAEVAAYRWQQQQSVDADPPLPHQAAAAPGGPRPRDATALRAWLRPRKVMRKGGNLSDPKRLGLNIRSYWRGFFSHLSKKQGLGRCLGNSWRCSKPSLKILCIYVLGRRD